MRTRSLTGPLLLLIVGGLFLWRNLHPDTPVFELIAQYWPFLLIGWGVLRLAEVAFWSQARTRAFSGGEVVLVVMICIAGSLVWAARENGIHIDSRGLNWWGSSYDYPVEATAPAGSAKRIVFENPRGSIKVTGADTTEVAVTGHKSVRAYARDDADRARLMKSEFRSNAKVEISRFKGLGEMMPQQLKETTMKRGSRTLIQVQVPDGNETETLVEQLMGKKPELRFQFIQENAQFAKDVDI